MKTVTIRRGLFSATLLSFLLIAGCATTPQVPVAAANPNHNLIDPRTGFTGPVSPAIDRHFERAWRAFQSGALPDAEQRFVAIVREAPSYLPARVALAGISLVRNDPDRAATALDEILSHQPEYLAANAYRAETYLAAGNLERAVDLYQPLVRLPSATEAVRSRAAELLNQYAEQLYQAAMAEHDPEAAIPLLRRALLERPDSPDARLALVGRLIDLRRFDEARTQIAPLLGDTSRRRQVEEELVEIDAGGGSYQTAISRLEKLQRDFPSPGYEKRLREIRQMWIEANMPPQYLRAIESSSITRSDLAVLLYWKISAIRFAQNLSQPPIAVDIADAPGREELIRALALHLIPVDPLTREAEPQKVVTAVSFEKLVFHVLMARAIPCAASVPQSLTDAERAARSFESCALPAPPEWTSAEEPVTGREAADVLDHVEQLFLAQSPS